MSALLTTVPRNTVRLRVLCVLFQDDDGRVTREGHAGQRHQQVGVEYITRVYPNFRPDLHFRFLWGQIYPEVQSYLGF